MYKKKGEVDILVLVVIGAVAWLLLANPKFGEFKLKNLGKPTSAVTVTVDSPSAELSEKVKSITEVLKTGNAGSNATILGNFYRDFATVIANDPELRTTQQVRTAYVSAGRTQFTRMGINDKYPGLAEAIDKVMVEGFGTENKAIGPDERKRAVEYIKAISYACYQGV